MTTSPLAKKLLIKPANRVLLLNSPGDAATVLGPLPEGAAVATAARGEFDVVLLFAHHSRDLERHGAKAIKMAYSHRKEYVGWIEEAKKAETRARRVEKAVEMMAAGQKDKNAKYRG